MSLQLVFCLGGIIPIQQGIKVEEDSKVEGECHHLRFESTFKGSANI